MVFSSGELWLSVMLPLVIVPYVFESGTTT